MSFRKTIPYALTSATMLLIGIHSMGYNDKSSPVSNDNFSAYNIKPSTKIDSTSQSTKHDTIAINAVAQRYDVVYTRADGNKIRRSGGTRAWRNNNPGCLRYSAFTEKQGAIGEAGGFAVFPDEATGMRAIGALLQSDKYKNLTISQAIFKYAPPHENDTDGYNASLRKMTGLPVTTKLSALNEDQLMRVAHAIRTVEGWRPGTETFIKEQAQDTADLYATIKNQMIKNSLDRTI